jgi:hypothetical protein
LEQLNNRFVNLPVLFTFWGAARPKGGCKPIGGMGDVCAGGM